MRMKLLASVIGILISGVGIFYLMWAGRAGDKHRARWEVLTEGTFLHERRFSHVFFFDKKTGIAVSGVSIERSEDGGIHWKVIPTPELRSFSSVIFTDNSQGWVVGTADSRPLIMRTIDRGLNWQAINFNERSSSELSGRFREFTDICFDRPGRAWAVGDGGIVEISADGDTLNASTIFPTKEALYSVSCSDSGEVWAVGQGGAAFQYQHSWNRKEMDEKYTFRRVLSKGNNVWILGAENAGDENTLTGGARRGVLLKSQDAGRTWENETPESADWLYDLSIKDGRGWLVGAGGSIYFTSDDGNSWVKSESPTQSDLRKIFWLDSDNGWICGGRATVLRYRK